jgi:arginine decarboxylase
VGQPQATRSAPSSQSWSVEDALELYNVPAWSSGYFSINAAGHVVVRPDTTAAHEIDLLEVVQGCRSAI